MRNLSIAALAVLSACVGGPPTRAQSLTPAPKVPMEVVGHFARPEIVESSAVAASRTQPGVYWTLNDSGGEPVVYAFDLAGRDLGAWRVTGARNQDWESLAVGPCVPGGPRACLYIGETGDNAEARPVRAIYRVPEPRIEASAPGATGVTAPAEQMDIAYEDGPHDVEAIYVAPDAAVWLVTKGRSKGVRAFRAPPDVAANNRRIAVARATLPIVPDMQAGRVVTDAALSPDGKALAVRTYAELYVFRADPATGEPDVTTPSTVCDLAPLDEPGGEGVDWHPSGAAQVLSSEGVAGQISLVRCRAPRSVK